MTTRYPASEADAHYRTFVERNRGFIGADSQQRLRDATILVAGCGSTGSAAVEPLVRVGVGALIVADHGTFELNNLNRQHASYADIGRNKAVVAAERALSINPYASVRMVDEGVTTANAADLVGRSDVVLDAVDVTTRDGLAAKFELHRAAAVLGRPVVSGYDMAGAQYVKVYDYRSGLPEPFFGRIRADELDTLSTWALLMRLVPIQRVPYEMLRDIRDNLATPDYSVPQLSYSALLFGALSTRLVVELLDGAKVRTETWIDVHRAVRTRRERMRVSAARLTGLVAAAGTVLSTRRQQNSTQGGAG